MNEDHEKAHLHSVLSRTGACGLASLYVECSPDEDTSGFRRATPEEIGATYSALMAGFLHVRVGRIEIDAQLPGDYPKAGSVSAFLIGQDAKVTIDGQPYSERTGLKLHSIDLHIENNCQIKVEIKGTPRCES